MAGVALCWVPGTQAREGGLESPGPGRAGRPGGRPLTALWAQPAHRGPSGRAARRIASVSSQTHGPATGRTAAASARRASGASGASTVSARAGWGGAGCGSRRGGLRLQAGLAEPAGPSLLAPAACEPGFFGPGCRQACACPPGLACDPVSGECGKQCPAGYWGEDCDQGERLVPGAGVRGVQVVRCTCDLELSQPCGLACSATLTPVLPCPAGLPVAGHLRTCLGRGWCVCLGPGPEKGRCFSMTVPSLARSLLPLEY